MAILCYLIVDDVMASSLSLSISLFFFFFFFFVTLASMSRFIDFRTHLFIGSRCIKIGMGRQFSRPLEDETHVLLASPVNLNILDFKGCVCLPLNFAIIAFASQANPIMHKILNS
jgi:hypothetical protein